EAYNLHLEWGLVQCPTLHYTSVSSAALAYRLSKIRKIHKDTIMGRSTAVNTESVRSSWMIAMIVFSTLITCIPQAIVNTLVGAMPDEDGDDLSGKKIEYYLVTMSYFCCVCRRVKSNKTSRVVSSPIPPRITTVITFPTSS
ncbi:hypothetical protein PRIPAC_96127, partial [Pristionchus pacificus]|uniref:Uncharacterized protein n=1 Tax=Pristionchus pacificus TaxID=54126 RepID=A0A2A6B2W1_PRIPA